MRLITCDVCDKAIEVDTIYYENKLGIVLCEDCFLDIEDAHLVEDIQTALDDKICDIDVYEERYNK